MGGGGVAGVMLKIMPRFSICQVTNFLLDSHRSHGMLDRMACQIATSLKLTD